MANIREIILDNPVIVAPMASVTNLAFRQLLMKYQPGLYFNEMVSDQAINYRNEKTLKMLEILDGEHPIAFQLFGHDVQHMVKAAQYLDQSTACDIIDINMGCPVNKVVKPGAGSALLKDIAATSELVYQIRQVVKKPLTVKMRLGWDNQSINAVAMAMALQAAGVDALFVHGRTRSQFYEGIADWEEIRKVKAALSIPVYGNGDITSGLDAYEKMTASQVDGIMIGRGLLSSPWLIKECKQALTGEYQAVEISLDERFTSLLQHALNLIELYGEEAGMRQMRTHGAWGLKGLPHSHEIKDLIVRMKSYDEFVTIIEDYKRKLR